MEDEEGYMALQPRPRNETSKRCLQVQRTEGVPKWPKKSKICLGILGAICGFLGMTLIGLTVFQCRFLNKQTTVDTYDSKNGTRSVQGPKRRESSACAEDIIIHLCEPLTGNSKCKLCPINWTSLKKKCYWVSKDKKDWLWAYSDCTRKRAQMLIVRDLEELEFIQNIIEENYPIWIGLNYTSQSRKWTWLDHSALDQNLISQPLPTTGISCGVVKGKQVRSEMCSAEFRWICEKQVILL